MGKIHGAVALGAAALLLAGCAASGPTRDEVSERFAIELAAGAGEPADWVKVADGLTDSALDGMCGSETYRIGLGNEKSLVKAWDATCLMYFEGDMSEPQVKRAKLNIVVG